MHDEEEEKPIQDFGNFFNVIFVARPESSASWNTMANADIENGYLKEGTRSIIYIDPLLEYSIFNRVIQ